MILSALQVFNASDAHTALGGSAIIIIVILRRRKLRLRVAQGLVQALKLDLNPVHLAPAALLLASGLSCLFI